ncbi:MAG TPA: metal ABC transporter substrate-binding protein [Nocardioidaceae bacterium]|nr:metal ABC transporter substrate-binding protein [Nocardioidaceae bacterium]
MKKLPRRFAAVALAAPLVLAGCAGPLGGDGGGTRVVASFYPLEYVAQRIVGEHADVVTLTSPGTEPHDLELTVRQTAEVSDADLVVYEKGLQPAVDAAVEEHGPEQVVEVTEVIDLAPLEAEEHEGESEGEHAEHADVDGDLHFWLDPVRVAEVAGELQARMAEVDPDNADDYEANLEALRGDLEKVDAEYEQGLADCRLDTVVVSHDAFGYLERYGLHFESIAGLSPDAEPSPKHLTELADLIESEGVTTVFYETLASPAMAETLASDLGLDTAVLDPIEGLSDATEDEDYLSLMRSNLQSLKEANGCR